jgi:hypothetical protein
MALCFRCRQAVSQPDARRPTRGTDPTKCSSCGAYLIVRAVDDEKANRVLQLLGLFAALGLLWWIHPIAALVTFMALVLGDLARSHLVEYRALRNTEASAQPHRTWSRSKVFAAIIVAAGLFEVAWVVFKYSTR